MRAVAMAVLLLLAPMAVGCACGGGRQPAAALTPAPTGTRTPAPTASATPAQPRPGVITIYNLRTHPLRVSVKGPVESPDDTWRLLESGQPVDFERFVEVDACQDCREDPSNPLGATGCGEELTPSTQLELSDGRYVLLHHNNDGRFEGCRPEESSKNRRPAFIALGEYRPKAEQPLWFSESKQLMDNQGAGIGPLKRIDIGVYPSFTTRGGNNVLWHPDRKFFLVGKRITREWLSDLRVP